MIHIKRRATFTRRKAALESIKDAAQYLMELLVPADSNDLLSLEIDATKSV